MRDVWMVERGQHLRLALESRDALGIERQGFRQYFDRHLAPQLRVARAVDFAHPARAERGNDFVNAETSTGRQRHGCLRRGLYVVVYETARVVRAGYRPARRARSVVSS